MFVKTFIRRFSDWIIISSFLIVVGYAQICFAQKSDTSLREIEHGWAVINYQETDEHQQEQDLTALLEKSITFSDTHSDDAKPLIWQAIIISTRAEIEGGLSALKDAQQARTLLLKAEDLDASAMNGLVYTCLGVLYYKVPGWPIGFGDQKIARNYLEKGLTLNPSGLDANFFYGDFLYQEGEYAKAETALVRALSASNDYMDVVAAEGRKKEARDLLIEAKKQTPD